MGRPGQEARDQKEAQMRNQLLSDINMMKRRLKMELTESTKEYNHQLESLELQINICKTEEKKLIEEGSKVKDSLTKLQTDLPIAKAK